MSRALIFLLLLLACCEVSLANTRIVTDTLDLEFAYDGTLNSAKSCFPARNRPDSSCMEFSESELIEHQGGGTSWKETPDHSDTHFQLRFESLSGAVLTWKIPLTGYMLTADTEGLSHVALTSGATFRPREAAGFGGWLEQTRYLALSGGDVKQLGLEEADEASLSAEDWIGYRNRYWALLLNSGQTIEAAVATAEGNADARIEWAVEPASPSHFSIYIGPVEPRVLAAASEGISDILYAGIWFWLRWICFALFYLLSWIGAVIPSWGLSVMIMSLMVHYLMLPLSRIADRFQQQVHATEARLAPELQRIKKNFKGEVQAAKILALYKTERVHPLYSLKSMLGVAVVIPVFIGAFDMLAENIHLLNASFLWISDLSQPDAVYHFPFSVPFFGSDLNLLPLLMTALSVAASALHNPPALDAGLRKKQLRNMLLLAIGFFALFYTFPAGMVLYWTSNNLISVIKSLWVRRSNRAVKA